MERKKLVVVMYEEDFVNHVGDEAIIEKLRRYSTVWAVTDHAGEVETLKTRTRVEGNTADAVAKAVRAALAPK